MDGQLHLELLVEVSQISTNKAVYNVGEPILIEYDLFPEVVGIIGRSNQRHEYNECGCQDFQGPHDRLLIHRVGILARHECQVFQSENTSLYRSES